MKKFAVAAAMMLTAVSASASNFRGADQVYLPIAGHLQGSSGTFISDVYLANLTADSVEVSVVYAPFGPTGGAGSDFPKQITLGPYERKEFKDFFLSGLNLSSGFGQLIFNGCKAGGNCGPSNQNPDGVSPDFRAISVESRIYQIANNAPANPPTTGQLFSGIPWYNFVSQLQSNVGLDKVFITGFTQTGQAGNAGTFRSNVGLVNASQWSSTTFVVTLYQGGIAAANKKGEYQTTVGPLGVVQPNFADIFPGVTGSNYWVTVEQRNSAPVGTPPSGCTQGCPAFLAYGSVLDNVSGDATTLEAQYLLPLDDDALLVIYPSSSGKAPIRRSVRH